MIFSRSVSAARNTDGRSAGGERAPHFGWGEDVEKTGLRSYLHALVREFRG